jgi:hypothetical protein
MKFTAVAAGIAAAAMIASTASAQVLTFEGIFAAPYPQTVANSTTIGGFYNGGTSGDGTTGTNYGIEFSSNALAFCQNTLGTVCSNGSRGGLGDPASAFTGLAFLQGTQAFMNRASGFTTGFSFFYTSIGSTGSFSVWDGLNGTGNLLGTVDLAATQAGGCDAGYGAGYCPYEAASLAFAGTAYSVTFAGVANGIGFDDVTFGSITPGTVVPEPGSVALVAAGLFGIAVAARRRKIS